MFWLSFWLSRWQPPLQKKMPPELLTEFLIDNHAHLIWWQLDDRGPVGQPRNWTTVLLDTYLKRARAEDNFFDVCGYEEVAYIYQALREFPVTSLTGMVVGSIWPWAEAISLAAGEHSFYHTLFIFYLLCAANCSILQDLLAHRSEEGIHCGVSPHRVRI